MAMLNNQMVSTKIRLYFSTQQRWFKHQTYLKTWIFFCQMTHLKNLDLQIFTEFSYHPSDL